MDQATHNKTVSFIWGIADDVLQDLFKRGKYPNVILPMFVIRRMDVVLEPTKQTVRAAYGKQILATVSQELSWNHFIELLPIKYPLARDFYAEMCRIERWSC